MTSRILFVGLNPSTASPDESPMHKSTGSYRNLAKHLPIDIINRADYINLYDKKTLQNKQLTVKKARQHAYDKLQLITRYNYIVALGNVVSAALTYHNIRHFKLWHPSGLCRKWNDKEATKDKIGQLIAYVNDRSKDSTTNKKSTR